jgi:hypothetical protein
MECLTRSMRYRITQKADRFGWHLSKARLLASDRALPILRTCLHFYDNGRVQYPTLRAKRLRRKGVGWITHARAHHKNSTDPIICQACWRLEQDFSLPEGVFPHKTGSSVGRICDRRG